MCAYFFAGNAVLRLHRLSDDAVVQEADLSEEGGKRAGKDDESVASGSTGAQLQASIGGSSSRKKQEDVRLGLCAYGKDGAALFAVVGNRWVVKVEAGTLKEIKRWVGGWVGGSCMAGGSSVHSHGLSSHACTHAHPPPLICAPGAKPSRA